MTEWKEIANVEEINLKYFFQGLKNIWQLLGQYRKGMVITLIWILFLSLLDLSLYFFNKLFFDQIQIVFTGQTIKASTINFLIMLIVTSFLIGAISKYLQFYVKEKKFLQVLIGLDNLLPQLAQRHLLALSQRYHERENIGRKISKITKGCDRVSFITMNLIWNYLPQIFFLIFNTLVMLFLDWRLFLIFVATFIPAVYINYLGWKKCAPAWDQVDDLKDKANGLLSQALVNVKTVQSYVQEDKENTGHNKVRSNMEKIDMESSYRIQNYNFIFSMISNVGSLLIAIASMYFLYRGTTTIGNVIYFLVTSNVNYNAIWSIVSGYTQISRLLPSVARLRKLLEEEIDIKNHPRAITPADFKGSFEFVNVTFRHGEKKKPLFNNFNLLIAANKMTALVGESGGGKSSLVSLLNRMHDIHGGQLLIDGHDIKLLDKDWLRSKFAVVHQEGEIFDDTLEYNIRYSNPTATTEQVLAAVEFANLKNTLSKKDKFPEGLQTQVGENGVKLSGGEKQRVNIARAYIALQNGAKVLILDEATSHLDSQTEKAIQNMLDTLRSRQDLTIVVIAHRLSTVKNADQICVLKDGMIVEKGDHQKLMNKNGLYSQLVELQELGELRE